MSFRIDDILKKDSTHFDNKHIERLDRQSCRSSSADISHRTLSNKPNYYYYRSPSVPYARTNFETNWHHSDKLCKNYFEDYRNKAFSYPSPSMHHPPLWQNFPPFSINLLSSFYHQFSKRKGGQVRFTANQTEALEQKFVSHKYLSPEDRKRLADSLKLTDRQVKTWFQNRRAKWRRSSISSTNSDCLSTKLYENVAQCEKPNGMFMQSSHNL